MAVRKWKFSINSTVCVFHNIYIYTVTIYIYIYKNIYGLCLQHLGMGIGGEGDRGKGIGGKSLVEHTPGDPFVPKESADMYIYIYLYLYI